MGLKNKDEILDVLLDVGSKLADSICCILDIIEVSGVYKKLDEELLHRYEDSQSMIHEAKEKLEELWDDQS